MVGSPTPWISHLLFLCAAFWLLALSPSFFFCSRAWFKLDYVTVRLLVNKVKLNLFSFVHLCLLHLAQFLVVALLSKQVAVVKVRREVGTWISMHWTPFAIMQPSVWLSILVSKKWLSYCLEIPWYTRWNQWTAPDETNALICHRGGLSQYATIAALSIHNHILAYLARQCCSGWWAFHKCLDFWKPSCPEEIFKIKIWSFTDITL